MSEDTQRISKVIARSGLASRREAESFVEAGRVKVNGQLIHHPGHPVSPRDKVMVDDNPLPTPAKHVYYLLNKPRGYITGRNDPEERKTVFELISNIPVSVVPIPGRGLRLQDQVWTQPL